MFKIESYIAPLLMGYVDKYVKLRPEDFQLSLWGGDAVLNNLNLRLDALEQAINLPISFKSGHIHELHLHVPWTRLGSEPVVITVNTIECIVRLKDSSTDSDKRSSKSESSTRSMAQSLKIKAKKQPIEEELPAGYLQGLVNKVINNVNIIVNNLILKFVEDDIVLSVNVKSAECYSVSPGWNRSFVEVTPSELILRKVINFCDLTVCLDKCDSSGRIEIYQEPLLYRCSLSCRMHLTYQSAHSKLPLITKVNILCEKLDVSLTDLQLPLVVRLIELFLALYYGTLQLPNEDNDSNVEPDSHQVFRQSEALTQNQEESPTSEYDDQGWASWAWSFVPQILSEDYEEEEEEEDGDTLHRRRKKPSPAVLCIGFYINNASVMLKLTETVREAVHFGPSRVLFRPFIYMEAGGIAVNLVLYGHSYLDVQCGITHLCVTSRGSCVCSSACNENISSQTLLKGGDPVDSDASLSYLTNSLFDIACAENVLQAPTFITDYDKHVQVYTEQYGMQKFGLFWFDYLYTVTEPERRPGSKSSTSSDVNSSEINANIRENALLTFVLGSVSVNVSSSLIHRSQKVFYCAIDHEYEPYSLPTTELFSDTSPLPTLEQVTHLEEYTPIRTYNVTVLEPKIYIFAAEHPQKTISKRKRPTVSRNRSNAKRPPEMSAAPSPLPAALVSASRFEMQFYQAMYPQHVVRLVSKLAGPSSQLMHNCYAHMQLRLFGLSVGLLNIDETGKTSPTETIISPCSGSLYKKSLLFPQNWKNPYLPSVEYMVEIPQFSLSIKKAHLHFVFHIWKTWLDKKPATTLADTSDTLFHDTAAQHKDPDSSSARLLPLFELTLGTFEMRCCLTSSANAFTGTLSSIQAVMYVNSGSGKGHIVPLISGPSITTSVTSSLFYSGNAPPTLASLESVDWLSFTVQLPSNIDTPEAPALLQLNVCGLAVMLDPCIYQWLSYTPKSKTQVKVSQPLRRQHEPTTSVTIDADLVQTTSPLQRNLSQASVASSGSTCHPTTVTGPSQSVTQTQSASQHPKDRTEESAAAEDTECDDWGNSLAKHFPLLRIMQLQITVQPWSVFFPTKSILQSEPNMDIPGNLKDAFNAGLVCDILVMCLPHVTIHTSGPRSIFMMQDIPVRSLEGSLLGDKLPWTITVSNYSMYSLHPMKKVFSLVKPGSVSCTVAVSTKYHPPASDNISSLALCLHLDMHTMKFASSLKQIDLCLALLNQLMQEGSKISSLSIPKASNQKEVGTIDNSAELSASKTNTKDLINHPNPSVFSHSNTHAPTYSTSISNDVNVTGYTETSGEFSREATPIRDQEMSDDPFAEGVKLSLWLQWTCPSCEIKFYSTESGRDDENQIVCLSEELAISVDIQEIYIKAKANIGFVSIMHYFRSCDTDPWKKGPYEGIILSCSPDLASNTQIVGPRLWSLSDNGLQTSTVNLFQSSTDQPREKRHGFLSLTFTRALCKNVKRRLCKLNAELIGLHDTELPSSGENLYFHKYISEVCVSMEPCDVVVYLPAIKSVFDMAELSQVMSSLHKLFKPDSDSTKKSAEFSFTTSSLPLMYVNLSCLRMFFPNGQTGAEARSSKNSSNLTLNHDMLFLQFHLLSLSSQADNPLPRYVVCKHLFAHGLQAGITHQPGSAIEDRQYQFDIKGLSLSSGCWQDFVKKNSKNNGFPETVSPSVQIPALEWNSLQSRCQWENSDVILVPVAYNFNLKVVLAPPIVYNRPINLEKVQPEFLVCGAALEVNVTTELDFFISINQLSLLHQVINKNLSCFFEINIPEGSTQQMENFDHVISDSSQVADSGLGSEISTTTNYKGSSLNKASRHITPASFSSPPPKPPPPLPPPPLPPPPPLKPSSSISPIRALSSEMPLEVLLTAGRISCMVYAHQYLQNKEQQQGGAGLNSFGKHPDQMPSESTTCSQMKVSPYIVPYLYLYFSQPHTVLALQPHSHKFEMSFYDIMVKGSSTSHRLPVDAIKLLPEYADFTHCWIETRAGQPHPKTGVPPSFFTLRLTDFLYKPAHVSLHMERPLKLNISPDMLLLIQQLYQEIDQSFKVNSRAHDKPATETPETHTPKSQEATFHFLSTLNWIDQLSLTSDQIVVSVESKLPKATAGLLASLTAINMDVTLNQCDNGVVNEILCNLCLKDVQLKTCLTKQYKLPFLGPTTLNFSTASQQCVHSGPDYLPKTVLTLEMGLLLVHFGQVHALCLRDLMEQFSDECQPLFSKPTKSEARPNSCSSSQDEFVTMNTVDDLRSGKFEYIIDPAITDGHPSANQILFCNCDNNGNSSMTWCYDQSRVLSHITISPVPFSLLDESTASNQLPSKIPCTLQYWDSLVNQFFAYQNFTLSENESSTLPLPEIRAVNGPELMAAQMWRVVIHQRYTTCHSLSSTSSGVDEFDGNNYPCVLPASLAACMRVDSCFIPSLVPVVQVLVTMPTLLLKLSNHFDIIVHDVPEKLKPFTFQENDPSHQEWGVLILESPAVMGSYSGGHTTKTSLQFSCACQLDIVEFRYLTQQTVVKPFSLQGEVTIIPDGECQLISVDCSVDNLMVRVGKGTVHTLHSTMEVWKQFLDPTFPNCGTKVVFNHYIICNDTYSMICFGQTGTTENLVLKSEEMYRYSWCSQKTSSPLLHVCVNAETWFWCDPFCIDEEGTIVRVVTTTFGCLKLIIKVNSLSHVQKQVIIRGQLLFSNRLSFPLEMKLVTNRHRTTYTAMTMDALKNGRSLIYDEREPCVLRLRQSGVPTAWSQEIHISGDRMKETRLVKIPILSKNQYIHLWCHIYSQDHGLALQKLIILSPLFVLKSHLPVPLNIDLETPKLGWLQQIEIPNEGQPYQLCCLGGDIVHSLSFQMGENSQRSTPAMAISTGMIEQVKRTPLSNPINIESLLNDWHKDVVPPKWPYIKIHEKYRDVVSVKEMRRTMASASKPPIPDAFSIDVDISLTEYWPGCSTVLLDIVPSYLFTNNTSTPLLVISPHNQQWTVPCGTTFTPTGIQQYFKLGLMVSGELLASGKIPLSDEEVAARRYRTDIGETLYTDGFVHSAIFSGNNNVAYFFTVNSSIHQTIRVITVSERFSVTNLSGTPYQVQTACVPLGYGKVSLLPTMEQCNIPSHSESKEADNLSPLLSWTMLFQEKHQHVEVNQKNPFVYYIRLREIDPSDEECSFQVEPPDAAAWSFPLRMTSSKSGVRLTTSVPIRASNFATSRPLVISGHTDEGLTYFVAEADHSPGCLLSNCCSFPLTYGQTLMNLTVSDVTVVEETENLDILPTLDAGKCVYYTMPFINSTFPEMPGGQILPKLHIGVPLRDETSGRSKARWSSGIDILSHYDTFLRIPEFSDIKVHVERVNMTTYLILEPVSKADISAKEIRSRIKGRETTVLVKDQIASGTKESVKKSSTFSSVMSLQKANMLSSLETKWDFCFNCGALFKNVCIIILDEMSSSDVIGEILCVSLSNLFLAHYPATNFPSQMLLMSKSCSSLCIGDIQIDNQLFHKAQYDFPVILIRQQSPTSSKKAIPIIESHMSAVEKHAILKCDSFLHLQVVLETDVSCNSSSFIRALDISVQPLALFVEDTFIYRLVKELQAFIPNPLFVESEESSSLRHLPHSLLQSAKVLNSPIRMQYLCIHPINTLLSVHASLKLFIASDHSPLSFGKFEKDEIYTSSQHLIRSITMHYASGALFRAGIVVGSLEILGNPTGLVRNIGTGVADLFKLPITGLTQGPGAFLNGVSQGMSSLLRNVTAGTLTSITNFASSVSRNMDRLSLDAGHLERQEENRRIRPTGLSDGLKQGLSGLGISLLGAIAGIADQPIQGVLSSQLLSDNSLASGFVTGVGKGLVGVVTKPIGGAAEFLSQTGQGILHGVGLTQVPKARLKPCLEPIYQGKNSSVKYLFKTPLSVMSVATLLMAVDVLQFDFAGLGSKVVLLLTPELLVVYDCEEDISLQTFALAEIECPAALSVRSCSNAGATTSTAAATTSSMEDLEEDSCVLSFVWQDQTKQMNFKDPHHNKDRVTAFLDSTPGFVPLPGHSSDTIENGCSVDSGAGGGANITCDHQSSSITSSPAQSASAPYFEFRIEPHYRETFLTLFQLAKNKLIGRGFLL
ncbi:vacuolar protein sorting-associated protein 13B-like [Argonauta hians]